MSTDEQAGWVAGGAVLAAIAIAGAAMVVVRRVLGGPRVPEAARASEATADEAVETGE
ncbi:hypothetical protein K8W59_04565 [Nocardioides rotundus]|uniref:hypothetical protein n=1 Tax=Nocardioides rotundus TaxID=1774216 RepID=UPI001CBBE577|nr:hypothetical protein [Nocardioides rotundus]UAL30784.1 hypothetical protein K8W59_04565 [Nocardioides rotundus]